MGSFTTKVAELFSSGLSAPAKTPVVRLHACSLSWWENGVARHFKKLLFQLSASIIRESAGFMNSRIEPKGGCSIVRQIFFFLLRDRVTRLRSQARSGVKFFISNTEIWVFALGVLHSSAYYSHPRGLRGERPGVDQ